MAFRRTILTTFKYHYTGNDFISQDENITYLMYFQYDMICPKFIGYSMKYALPKNED